MNDQDIVTEKTKLEEKLAKSRGPKAAQEFVAELEGLTKEQLEKRLLDYAKTAQGIINTRNSDKVLADLAAEVAGHRRGYTEQLNGNKDLTRLVSLIISEKFGDELMDLKVSEEDAEESSED